MNNKNKVIIQIYQGIAEVVQKPARVIVEIHDYDIGGIEEDFESNSQFLGMDEYGEKYWLSIYGLHEKV